MSATFDTTTKAAYDAATTAQARAEAVVASLTGTISVKVFNGSNTEMGSGTMAAPWATPTAGAIVLGEVSSFTVGTTATPDADWYIRFQNADVSRWARGSFGLSSSSQDFTWSLAAWTATDTGTIGTATIVCTGNEAPVFSVAPTSASIAATGGTIQFTATDPEGGSIFYSLTTTRAGITIDSTGLVTVTAAAAGTSGNIVVQASDGILTTSATCNVSVTSGVATYTIVAGTASSTFEGNAVSPGEVVEFQAGTHGPRTIQNLQGTADEPIVLRSAADGRATIRRSSAGGSGFVCNFRNCRHIVIDGSYTPGETYGLRVMHAPTGVDMFTSLLKFGDNSTGLSNSTPFSFITVRYVEIDGGWPTNSGEGIGLQFNDGTQFTAATHPTLWHESLLIEHCYIHDVEGEGIYAGPNWGDGDLPCRNLEIRHNLIENTGWDGIQPKAWIEGTNSVHHNVVRNAGMNESNTSQGNQFYGISLAHSVGDVYSNWVENAGSAGIQVYVYQQPESEGLGPFVCLVYNNVVVGTRDFYTTGYGITCGSDATSTRVQAFVYNNTLVDNAAGILLNSRIVSGSVVANNIVADSGSVSVPGGSSSTNNQIGTAAAQAFVSASDYHLTASSPAVDAATGVYVATLDYDGVSRPRGAGPDQGAYEYVA